MVTRCTGKLQIGNNRGWYFTPSSVYLVGTVLLSAYEINSENLYILALSPFSLANELVQKYADCVRLVVSMGGHDASYSGDDMEFNQSLDPSSFDALKQICIERGIPHSNITYEECLNYNDLLISVSENLSDFYTRFRYYCDAYTAQMQKLDMPTTCYDLIAALKFTDELTE